MLLAFFLSLAASFNLAFAANQERSLSAATLRTPLRTRASACTLRNETELTYTDGENLSGETAFLARVRLTSSRPILVLEELEDWIGSVECRQDAVVISRAHYTTPDVLATLQGLVDGHVVTSHSGCNDEHERLAYRVNEVMISDDVITLAVTPGDFRKSFDSVKVTFHPTDQPHELRTHREIRRRSQLQPRQASATAALSSLIPSFTPPAPSSTAAASDSNSGSIDVSFSVDKGQSLPVPSSFGVEVSCNECSTTGTIDVTFAEFDLDLDPDVLDDDGIGFNSGGVTVVTHGLGATVNLKAALSNSQTFMVPLVPDISFQSSVNVPGLGSAYFAFGPFIAAGWDYTGTLEADFGFEMTVPDGAEVVLDLSSLNGSNITGFDNTELTPIPFVANAEISDLGLWIALRSTVAASFSIGPVDASGNAGVFIDTPVLYANVTSVQNVDTDCNPTTTDAVSTAIKIAFSRALAFGAYAGFSGAFDWNPLNYYVTTLEPTPIEGTQGVQCRKFDNGEYVAASAATRFVAPIAAVMAVVIAMSMF